MLTEVGALREALAGVQVGLTAKLAGWASRNFGSRIGERLHRSMLAKKPCAILYSFCRYFRCRFFWLAPPSVSVPAYIVVIGFSASIYYLTIKAMRQPVITGREGLLHNVGKIVDKQGQLLHVHISSEVWIGESDEDINVGDHVEVIDLNGLKLKVQRRNLEALK